MSSLWPLVQNWKIISLLAASALPFSSFLFLSSSKKFDWDKPKGVNAYIKLFVINGNGQGAVPTSASSVVPSGGGNQLSSGSSIILAGADVGGDSTSGSKLELVAKSPLTSIESLSSWEYCLPLSSSLSVGSKTVATKSSVDSNCDLKKWSNSITTSSSKNTQDENSEKIRYLLELSSKFIRLQHQINMIYLFHASKKTIDGSHHANNDERLKRVNRDCGFSDSNSQGNGSTSLVQQMLLTVQSQSKKCLPFPMLVELYLKLKNESAAVASTASNVQHSPSDITKETIKKGELWGQISYGLTDYWGNVKKLKKEKPQNNQATTEDPLLIDFPLVLNYDLSNSSDSKDMCSSESTEENVASKPRNFDTLWKKYEDRSLRLCDYFQIKKTKK